jgi:hypothetical protein
MFRVQNIPKKLRIHNSSHWRIYWRVASSTVLVAWYGLSQGIVYFNFNRRIVEFFSVTE